MLNTFQCHENHATIYDFSYNSGLESCRISSDLFCVIRDNSDDRWSKQSFDTSLKKQFKHKWPKVFSAVANSMTDDDRDTLKFGDYILVFDEVAEEIKVMGEFG